MITSAEMISKQLLSRLHKSDKLIEFGIDAGARVRVGLYHTPDLTRMLKLLLPARWNEVVGVCHIKAYIFDDNVLISGANLSSSYFTNRQDRYIWIHQSSELADYLCNLVSTVANFSYSLRDESKVFANPSLVDPIYEPKAYKDRLAEAVNKLISLQPDMEPSRRKQNKINGKDDSGLWLNNVCANTWVFPTTQMGPVGIEQDELCTFSMLRQLPAGSHLDFSSAYFNLTPEFESVLLEASADKKVDILTASPEANGFYGSRGASGLIPLVYSLLEQSLYRRAENAHKEGTLFKVNNVLVDESGTLRIFEYKKENWTFHAKGLWCSLPGEGIPSITLVGSSNFGHRSKHRDLEAQLVLMTSEPSLGQSLKQEKDHLYSYARIVNENTFCDKGCAHGPAAKLAAHFVRGWL
ncbi:hypothetical protein O6H91_14G058900 [Diphasiastrum complanatum]|nr:hypothetical protein O6H91_14G058900 [Diphasiastrum complanatum]